ncbi:unnamed protein product [Somion occarium]|uniref:Halogenase n=1 Tax=Somion occarium TaxID=3059160 RepID=A0ABP1DU44_9APHY
MLPPTTQILVIGGGPAGSYSSAALAREGFNVVLLEMAHFPRYHVGESLIPSVRHYLRFIDAESKVANFGFVRKPGSAIKFNQYMQEGYTDFVALGASNSAWNVTRAHFDDILLRHAQASGVDVFEGVRITAIQFVDGRFEGDEPNALKEDWEKLGKPVSATYVTDGGEKGEIQFDYLVDASGRAGVMSTKYLKNRRYNDSLKNVAIWGYWRGTGMYGRGTERENAPFFEALSDESGWAWFIPLHNGLTSVGIVMDQKQLGVRSRACSSSSRTPIPFPSLPSFAAFSSTSNTEESEQTQRKTSSLAERYLTFLHLAPGVLELIGEEGKLVEVREDYERTGPSASGSSGPTKEKAGQTQSKEIPIARSASDFSYSAGRYAGNGWRVIGDAGAFIDPFFSSGVHLACTGALAAAASIAASLRGDCSEREAAEWCHRRIAISYTRFLVVVLSAYKQIRAQSSNVLADIGHRNFDRAFAFLRPVIQGGAEMGAKLSEDEVQRALDFCVNLFSPTTPEQHAAVHEKLKSLRSTPEDSVQTPATPPHATHRPVRPPPLRSLSTAISQSRRRSIQIVTSVSGDGIREEDEDLSAERLLDVRAPIISPQSLTKFLRTTFRARSNTMPAPSLPPLSSPLPSPVATSFDPGVYSKPASGVRKSRQRSGTVSTTTSRTTTTTPSLSLSSSISGTTTSSLTSSGPPSPLGIIPSDLNLDSDDEVYHSSRETPTSDDGESKGEEDSEVKMVLDKVNARRVIHAEHGEGLNSLEQEAVAGFVVRLVRGNLGLTRAQV